MVAKSDGKPITFIIPGQRTSMAATRGGAPEPLAVSPIGRVKESVRIGAHRGAGEARVTAIPGEDVVVIHIAGGPSLTLHPENARDLILAQSGARTVGGGTRAGDASAEVMIDVPAQLQWRGREELVTARGATRSFIGDVVMSAVEVITDLVTDKAADLLAGGVATQVDAQVDAGVYQLRPDALPSLKKASLAAAPSTANGAPLLVLVHGTFSNTSGTFGRLWGQHAGGVRTLFDRYRNAVYALDHPTLGVSPIANALTLAEWLPANARVHLLTHSRGGLVAEVLARLCGNSQPDEAEFSTFPPEQRQELSELAALVRGKRISVDRVVRVACPARGTLLASKRLDAYVSVFKWMLELAGIPVLPQVVAFLGSVAQRRTDPEILPGLAAQIPDSPLVQWLHSVGRSIPGELRIVAGDIEGDSLSSWLKTLLADGFFWTDNDFVVQTRSMYGGAPRAQGATFMLDQGGKVSHFGYFGNDRTADAVVNAVVRDDVSAFRTVGPLSWAGRSSSGDRAAVRPVDARPPHDKPALFVVPGMLGSNLAIGGQQIWLTSRLAGGLTRLKYDPQSDVVVQPDGLVADRYDALVAYMADTHETIPFAYDWRHPIEDEARRLADAIEAAMTSRRASGQPVRILAHSSGGLLARAVQLERPKTWDLMMARQGARVLMLGTSNSGTWTPMQVLSGDETFGGTLTAAAAPFRESEIRDVMASFPGFLQLQAGLIGRPPDLSLVATWEQLAADDLREAEGVSEWHRDPTQRALYRWGIPAPEVLARAVAFRQRLDEQMAIQLAGFNDKLAIVVGSAPLTPNGYENGHDGFAFLDVPRGDGRVTLESALLPDVPAWEVDCDHGQLASHTDAFRAYHELLENGTTSELPRVSVQPSRSMAIAAATPVRNRPSRMPFTNRPPEREAEVFAVSRQRSAARDGTIGPALSVTVVNGDLMFVRQPLLLGHYRSMRLTGTEAVMDRLVGGTMSASLNIGHYPDPPGTWQIFVNTHRDPEDALRLPRPEAVVVVGLGEEGKLTAATLVQTVRQGVIAWAQRVAEQPGAPALFELAATLVGSGGRGIGVAQSAQLIAEAVRDANERLVIGEFNTDTGGADGDRLLRRWPRVERLRIIELYLDRATEAWRALRLQAEAMPGRYVIDDAIENADGALPRPLESGYRGAAYDFITAVTQQDEAGRNTIAYALDTRRARTEVTAQVTQVPLVRELVDSSNTLDVGGRIGRTLFNLLVPVEIEPFLGGSTEMVIELDGGTAGIPWELLDTDTGVRQEAEPWAIRAKLVRKLRLTDFRVQVADASTEACILVIGEPMVPAIYPPLPGARREARAVAEHLCAKGSLGPGQVTILVSREDEKNSGPDTRTVLTALYERPWRIIHIAGHGEPPLSEREPRGVVLSQDSFLGPAEVRAMRVVPELVFVNCCHLAGRTTAQLLSPARFAAIVAEELIKIGVRCVVAAGWAVGDRAAQEFATAFYDVLLRGGRFIDAVAEARRAARAIGGNTWAAYQCYGDPEWQFAPEVADAQRPQDGSSRASAIESDMTREFAGVASSQALQLALDTITVEIDFRKRKPEVQHDRLKFLEDRFAARWGKIGRVAEAFGAAWAGLDRPQAIAWYQRALAAPDGSASFKAAEQLWNLQAREATSRQAIRDTIQQFERLESIQPSMERKSLLGSAYKRLALIEAAAGRKRAEGRAIESMQKSYAAAEQLARDGQVANLFYPALNYLVADLAMHAGADGWAGLSPESVETVRSSLAAKVRDDPDFWSVVGETELRIYEAIAHGNLATELPRIERDLADLAQRAGSTKNWGSVHDNARFLLPKYAARAAMVECQAAEAILSRLEKLADAVRS